MSWMLKTPGQREKERKRESKRSAVLGEIISTEEIYLKKLNSIIDDYEVPLLVYCKQHQRNLGSDLTIQRVNQAFASIRPIRDFHVIFLDQIKADKNMADVFQKFSKFLRIYISYVNNYEGKETTMGLLRKKSFLKEFWVSIKNSGKEPIESLLIAPVQRVPRYLLLLRELVKHTEEGREKLVLEEALESVSDSCEHINKSKMLADSIEVLQQLQSRISGDFPSLIQPHRHLIKEGEVLRGSNNNFRISSKETVLFLFNDILLWTSIDYKFKNVMKIKEASCRVITGEDEDKKLLPKKRPTDFPFLVEIGDESSREIFFAKSQEECLKWVQTIKAAVESIK